MTKVWISLCISFLLTILGFVWCLPYSNSIELIKEIFINIIKSSLWAYLPYIIFIILDKFHILYKLYSITDKAIVYIPYCVIFVFSLNIFIALFLVFGIRIYDISYRFISFASCLHANELIH